MKKLTPVEWCEILGAEVIDSDGWRGDGRDWRTPIGAREFMWRFNESTVHILDRDLWAAWKKFCN
jgi:hypothetical protein